MSAVGCHQALAAVGRSAPLLQASLGDVRRHAAAAASLAVSTMPAASNYRYRRRLVTRAAIDVPPPDGVEASKLKEEVEVNLPDGSNVLTIKKKKKPANADELLDVRLLLTEEYDTKKEIKVDGTNKEGKLCVEVIIHKTTIPPNTIEIN